MKIASVETYLLRIPVDPYRYGASSKGWIRDRSSLGGTNRVGVSTGGYACVL
jgi:hypothetical protein